MNENKEKFTLMIVPHSGKSTFSISIPVLVLKILGGTLAVIIVAVSLFAAYFSTSYKKIRTDAEKLAIKSKDYDVLQKQLEFFVEKTHKLEEKMEGIEKLDSDLRDLLEDDPALKKSVEESDDKVNDDITGDIRSRESRTILSSRGGIDRQRALTRLQLLEQKIPKKEKSLEELKDVVIQRSERLCHTPSIYPVAGKLTSSFGYRRSPFGRRWEFHDGLDIAASYGSAIVATADGTVSFVGYRSGYGNTVTINHGYGYETSYCHNSKVLVKTGQQVKKGQTIAKVGNSGRSTGPHVHYMVKVNGELKNPVNFLK